jgi:glutathione reductase (NADPH)
MTNKGVQIERHSDVSAITKQPDGSLAVQLTTGKTLECDAILYAVGRRPNVAGLGLAAAGVTLGADDAIVVDRYSRTAVESIYAIGDVTARMQLTPVALAEAMALVATLFDGNPTAPDHTNVPVAVFSQPSVSAVGMTEAQARAACGAIDIYKSSFKPLKHTLSGREARTFMKLVVDGVSQRVLGAHMVGPDAAEIIQGLAIAIKLNATKQQFDATVGLHPTAAEEFVTMREKWKG